ncbi:MAG: GGDEF domain-containing protein [Lachnospiraceae bacterium]|nr:GGDEF domain-containing protein [Lachnospiraceae bacterium]
MTEPNLFEIFIANGIGLLLMLGLLRSNAFIMQKKIEASMLYLMAITLVVCCLVDPIVFILDGKPGKFIRFVLYFGNLLLYMANLIFSPVFLLLIERNAKGYNSKWLIELITIMDFVCFTVLMINFFKPLVFYIDETNRYQRLPLYFVYTGLGIIHMILALGIYLVSRLKGGVFKDFPAVELLIPTFIGLIVQGTFYGISLIWPASAVGLILMVLSMQNRNLLIDSMTGLYNRQYLTNFKHADKKLCIMMIDLNDFKSINDKYGHSEGDRAIIKTANLLNTSVGVLGTAVRYAGDEFIILINTDSQATVRKCLDRMHHNFSMFNANNRLPYTLHFSCGWGIFDLNKDSMDKILKIVDSRMYEDKRAYYEKNDRRKHR